MGIASSGDGKPVFFEGPPHGICDQMVEASPVGIAVVTGPDHHYLYANNAYRALRRVGALGLTGRTVAQVFPEFTENNRLRILDEVRLNRQPQHLIRAIAVEDFGGIVYRHIHAIPIGDETDDLIGIYVTDLTSEFRTIIDTVPAMVFIAHDTEGRQMSGNRQTSEFLGLSWDSNVSHSAKDVRRSDTLYANGRKLDASEMPVQRAARGEDILGAEIEVRFDDGSVAWVQGNASPLRDTWGKVTGAVGAYIDITQRKRAEMALAEAKREAEQAVAAKSRFLAAVSHDLRQPLHALNMYVEILADMVPDPNHQALARARLCLDRLTAQFSDLLDLSRFDVGGVRTVPTVFTLADVFDGVASAVRGVAEGKGVAIRVHPTLRRTRTDRNLLERLLTNLLVNAVRYTERGGVLLGCRRRNGQIWVEVWDTGMGIPQDQLGAIFDEFHQINNPARNSEHGTGLGLAIVDRIAKTLGLEVAVRSTVGKGSVFAVAVPEAR